MPKSILTIFLSFFIFLQLFAAERLQLKNLPFNRKIPRVKVTGRIWPEKYGEGSVCLWQDDKLAVFSLTIDDNCKPDHPFWIEMGKKYGYRWTWFVIAGKIGKNTGFEGTWEDWRKLVALGHDVQSHTVTHLHPESPLWKGIEVEYADAITMIEKNIPDHKVLVLAYPGGKNKKLNNPEIAAKYYLAARGTSGVVSQRKNINYLGSSSIGSFKSFFLPEKHWASFAGLLNPANKKKYRGWYNVLFHGVKKDKEKVDKALAVIKENEKDIWVGTYSEIARYGQEADTAKLNISSVKPDEIKFSLSDDMDDKLFTYPLTVKIRLAADWQTINAEQNGKKIPAKIVKNNSAKFALVQAVPDQGQVVLKK